MDRGEIPIVDDAIYMVTCLNISNLAHTDYGKYITNPRVNFAHLYP